MWTERRDRLTSAASGGDIQLQRQMDGPTAVALSASPVICTGCSKLLRNIRRRGGGGVDYSRTGKNTTAAAAAAAMSHSHPLHGVHTVEKQRDAD